MPAWHTCSHCQRILIEPPDEEDPYGKGWVTLPHIKAEAYEARKDGCPLFLLCPKIPLYEYSFIQSLYPSSWTPWVSPRDDNSNFVTWLFRRTSFGPFALGRTALSLSSTMVLISHHLRLLIAWSDFWPAVPQVCDQTL
jgi:hypothetical protein